MKTTDYVMKETPHDYEWQFIIERKIICYIFLFLEKLCHILLCDCDHCHSLEYFTLS